jgi:type IV pilus assembly protein PilY1
MKSHIKLVCSILLIFLPLLYFISRASPPIAADTAAVGFVGMPAVTNNVITSGAEYMYALDYTVTSYSGNLHKYSISSSGTISSTDTWTGGAAAVIDTQNWDTGRKIFTSNGSSGVTFRWASLSSTQQTNLVSQSVLNFIRGDRSQEAPSGSYRQRTSTLGDLIHSTPVYWVENTLLVNNVLSNAAHCSSAACKTVFVGSNDGMMHAIDATTGAERFAFIPSGVIDSLPTLTDPAYSHQYFVDGQLSIKKFTVSGNSKVILVGTMGRGDQGLFALDITNPNPTTESAAAAMVLWDKNNSSTGYSNIANIMGRPSFTADSSGNPLVITGNGYVDTTNTTSDGQAYLFVINALTGAVVRTIQAGTSGTSGSPNGLSTPTLVDTNLDGVADYAYAGDINGNLWKFNLSTNTATKLFTTTNNRSITMAPQVTSHPNGGYIVNFVTGKLLVAADETDVGTDSAYGIWDQATGSTIVTQTLTEAVYTNPTTNATTRVRTVSSNAVNWTTAQGWKVDLPIGGERVLGGDDAIVTGGSFRFLSSNPTINSTSSTPGSNWWMELNALTGSTISAPRFDLNEDYLINSSDLISGSTIPVGRYLGPGVRSQLTTLFANGYAVFYANYDRNGAASPTSSPTTRGVAGGHFDVEVYKGPNNVCSGQSTGGGAQANGSVKFTYSNKASYVKIMVGTEVVAEKSWSSKKTVSANSLVSALNGTGSTNYNLTQDPSDSSKLNITAGANGSAWNGTVTVILTVNGVTSTSYTIVNVTGGVDASPSVSDSNTTCSYSTHKHEYDDLYDKTGVNFLNASVTNYNLGSILSSTQQFKVLVMNQYLNPASMIHIGDASYRYDSASGYQYIKNYQTTSAFSLSALPTYTMSTIGSLAINLPTDGFGVTDWWGNGDSRNGLIPTTPACVYYGQVGSGGSLTGNILADYYSPVVPPANGTNGAGTLATTGTVANGARHGGALTLQIIKASTPSSSVEENVAGRPEYGHRVKSADFYTYVLAEYTMFWHHPRRICFNDSTTTWYNGTSGGNGYPTAASGAWNTSANMTGKGWTKNAPEDTSSTSAPQTPATGSTDPKLGSFGSISQVIGSGSGSSSGTGTVYDPSYGTISGGSFTNVVTGGRVNVSTPVGSTTATVTPTLSNVYGKSYKLGRLNWREIRN